MLVNNSLSYLALGHLLVFSGAIGIFFWTAYCVVRRHCDDMNVKSLANWAAALFALLWLIDLLFVLMVTYFDITFDPDNSFLAPISICVFILTLTGLVFQYIAASILDTRSRISKARSRVLCVAIALGTVSWFLAGFVVIASCLTQFSMSSLLVYFGFIILSTCLIAIMVSESIYLRLNMIRARAAIYSMGLSPAFYNGALPPLTLKLTPLKELLLGPEKPGQQSSLYSSFGASVLILKLVVPFFIISEALRYLGYIEYISFLFEPITNLFSLPPAVAVALGAAFFLNIYAGVAVGAGLSLTPYEWTIVGTFIAICHSIPLEAAVLKKVGFPINLHWVIRLSLATFGAWIASVSIPQELVGNSDGTFEEVIYRDFFEMLNAALVTSVVLAIKVIVLVVTIVILFDLIRKLSVVNKLMSKHTYLSSLTVGGLLGVTYGAGILLQDMKSVDEHQKKYLLLFLLLAHGLIEETLIFAFFGADIAAIFAIRIALALSAVFSLYFFYKYVALQRSFSVGKSK